MLAEIIKSVSPSPTTMLNLVMQLGAHQPKWDDMALPPGKFGLTLKNRSRHVLTFSQVDLSTRAALPLKN
jgi:hypothetical protein